MVSNIIWLQLNSTFITCCSIAIVTYKDIWAAAIWEVLVYSTKPTNVRKVFVVELYSHQIFWDVFCVQKYFYSESKANYGILFVNF